MAPRDHQDRAQATECDAAPEQLQVLALQGVALVRGVDRVAVLLLDAGQIRAAGRVARAAFFGSEHRQSGLTVFRTEDSSTGNAPRSTYLACVEQKNSNAVYAPNQCDALKGKNLKLLWGGVALGGLGAVLMITGSHTYAELSSGAIGVFYLRKF